MANMLDSETKDEILRIVCSYITKEIVIIITQYSEFILHGLSNHSIIHSFVIQ